MAKKTAKKEPTKASAGKATKAPAKSAAKVAPKAAKPVKATKTEKLVDKKAGAAKKSAPAKTAVKPAVEKVTAVKTPAPKAAENKSAPASEKQSVAVKAKIVDVVVEAKPAKAAKPAKMTAAEKKAAKISRDQTKALTEDYKKWLEFQDQHGDERPQKYTMAGQFEAQRPIEHPKFGWGFVISNIEDRLEVLFDSGVRFLISNRKS